MYGKKKATSKKKAATKKAAPKRGASKIPPAFLKNIKKKKKK